MSVYPDVCRKPWPWWIRLALRFRPMRWSIDPASRHYVGFKTLHGVWYIVEDGGLDE